MMKQKPTGLSKTIRYFYGVGDFAFALMSNVSVYYSTYFLTDVAKLPLAAATFVTGVTALIDSFTAWIYGAVMNSLPALKWGRYRSWLIILSPIIPFIFFFQYMVVGGSVVFMTAWFFTLQLLGRFTQNFGYVANVTMINIVAKTPDEKVLMASNRSTYNNGSKFAWSYIGIPFLALLMAKFGPKYAYAILSCLMSILMCLGMYAHFKMFEGYEDTGAEERANVVKAKRAKTSGMDLLKGLFANPPLLILLVADFGKWCFNFVVAGTVVYYFKYVALNMPAQATYTLIIAFCSVIGAYFSRQIGKALGAKMTLVIGFLIMAGCLFAARFTYTQMWPVIILVSAAQLFYGVTYSVSSAMYADVSVYNEWKTGKNASGWIMGLINIPLKAGSTIRSFIIAAALAAAGFNASIPAGKASVAVKEAIANTLLTIPGAILVVAALVLLVGYKLDKTKLLQMQKEIDERHAAEDAAGEGK